ncbi:MAG: hypothetical protein ACYC27_09655 [Armatimonadota bacterium]
MDDYKYSIERLVVYTHENPEHANTAYGPGGPERSYGIVMDVHMIDGDQPHWEYTIRNQFTEEERRVNEEIVYHGADCGYLDINRHDGIVWTSPLPQSARDDAESSYWKRTLEQFVKTDIPRIREREIEDERSKVEGRQLDLESGDYIKIRGDLRYGMDSCHNLYAKILSVSNSDFDYFDIPEERKGISSGKHRVLRSYHVRLENGTETDIYDIEIKAFYTTNGRNVVLNWRAATFLAEVLGDDPPYELQLEYLCSHIFSRVELGDISQEDLGNLLAYLLYSKGLIVYEDIASKSDQLTKSPRAYLVDQILAISRFDMKLNRSMTGDEIEYRRLQDDRLRDLLC